MRLTRVEIEGYRSVSETVDLRVDPDVTVMLGANDHGKTNILCALLHLNDDKPFEAERDLNWDRENEPGKFPRVTFYLDFSDDERAALLSDWETWLQAQADKPAAPASPARAVAAAPTILPTVPPTVPPAMTPAPAVAEEPVSEEQAEPPAGVRLTLQDVPHAIVVERRGVAAALQSRAGNVPPDVLDAFAKKSLPRVELIVARDKVPDSVTVADLARESHDFMRGIFYYADLDPRSAAAPLFTQGDATMMQLRQASERLNTALKADWTQGKELRYELWHDSKTSEILLRIHDPAVTSRMVRASRRSSGFTHFFALKTVLYARERDNPANSYIFLFDEPGIYLHPSGQYDLLQVLDAIATNNQVIYSTHSLFMINKTFPIRHRLIVKTPAGTTVDGKPFIGRWGPTIEALGLSLAGTILFAQHVLLAEGDADPMLMLFLFQKLNEMGKTKVDLNAFSVISTGDSNNTDALIRILKEGAGSPNLMVLVDGDRGGKQRLSKIRPLLDLHNVPVRALDDDLTTEDYLPDASGLYVSAAGRYIGAVAEASGTGLKAADVVKAFEAAAVEDALGANPTVGVSKWVTARARKLGRLKGKPSKIGIAREYLQAAAERTFTDAQVERALGLLKQIQTTLGIPEIKEPEKRVTTD